MHDVDPRLYTTVILEIMMISVLCIVWGWWQEKEEEEL
jgi:hypothetical protein